MVVTAALLVVAWLAPSGADARVLLVGSWHGHHGSFTSIQAAVDAARPGDWVLIGPGDYHERGDRDPRYRSLAENGAGVMITTAGIHLRGMDRNRVVVDGTKPGSPTVQPRRVQAGLRAARGRQAQRPQRRRGLQGRRA